MTSRLNLIVGASPALKRDWFVKGYLWKIRVKDRTAHYIPRNLSSSVWGQSPGIIESRGVLTVASINSVDDSIVIISLIPNSATFVVNDSQVNRTNPVDSGGRGELPALIG
jgi:hypothetical protein